MVVSDTAEGRTKLPNLGIAGEDPAADALLCAAAHPTRTVTRYGR